MQHTASLFFAFVVVVVVFIARESGAFAPEQPRSAEPKCCLPAAKPLKPWRPLFRAEPRPMPATPARLRDKPDPVLRELYDLRRRFRQDAILSVPPVP
jgi:hypothetical protein